MNGTGTFSSLNGSATLQTAGGGGGAFNCADLLDCPSFTDLQTEIAAASLAISGLETSVGNLETSVGNLETEVAGKFDIPTGTASDYLDGTGTPTPFPGYSPTKTVFREVRNQTGATLTKGTAVYISGASGNKASVSKAIANADATSAQTFGLIFTDLANNENGLVIVFGDITDLNTSAYTEGAQLYLSATTAGTLTTTKQYAPNHLVYIGVVTRSHPNQGSIEVKIQNGYELDELHNVQAQSPADRNGIFFESSSNQWKARSLAPADLPKVIRPALIYTGAALAGNPGNGIETVIQTLSIPANTLSAGDIIRIGFYYSFPGNAATKTPRVRIGSNISGNLIYSPSAAAASVTLNAGEVLAIVTSSTNIRFIPSSTVSGLGTGTAALTNNTVDLTQAIPFSFNILKTTGTDTAILEAVFIEILKQ